MAFIVRKPGSHVTETQIMDIVAKQVLSLLEIEDTKAFQFPSETYMLLTFTLHPNMACDIFMVQLRVCSSFRSSYFGFSRI